MTCFQSYPLNTGKGLLWRNRAEVSALAREGRSVKRTLIDARTKRAYEKEEADRQHEESR